MEVLVAATTDAVKQAGEKLKAAGHEIVVVDNAEEAARRIDLIGISAAVIGEDMAEIEPFAGLEPPLRRRVMVIQVGNGVRTADDTVAFIRGVNMVVSAKDLGRLNDLLTMLMRRHRELVGLLEPDLVS